jgi:gamma-glutamylcyclotransferase
MQIQDLETTLYFGYGANTNREIMLGRCPSAELVAVGKLLGYRLVFHKYLSIETHPGGEIQGAVWRITKRDLTSLDRAEGLGKSYTRAALSVNFNGSSELCWAYQMLPGVNQGSPPDPGYVERVGKGYRELGIPLSQLHEAVERATA